MFDEITVAPGEDFTAGAFLFFSLREVYSSVTLHLTYTNLADNTVLLERTFTVKGEPLRTTDVALRINEIPVPHPGCYVWELFHGQEQLGSARVEVKLTDT